MARTRQGQARKRKGSDDVGILPCHRKARTITAGHGKNCRHRPSLRFPSMRTGSPTPQQARARPHRRMSGVASGCSKQASAGRRCTRFAPAAHPQSCSIAQP
ncbi:hypothetical protein XAP3CFBP6996_003855 [Xanthomonas citri pv. fuscans CFBP 6996]|nr:hypothetical protein XAP3CFBP6996_003855 [Xanthomonas citri pv. fuscans CFBP 6996]QWN15093.1 hypothetical protein DGN02_03875 [Xanthomonas citri]